MKYYETIEEQPQVEEEVFCDYCWDKKKNKEKELFFLDRANNLRLCKYCPNCGRQYENEAY